MRIFKLIIPLSVFFGWLAFSTGQAGAAWPPDSAYVSGVIGHPQQWNLSCESRAAADFAAFFGRQVSEGEILAYTMKPPRTDNPNYGFVGDPEDTWGQIPPNSYGVHSNPIESALRRYGLPVYGERSLSWDFVRSEIASGQPVIVWIIGAMWPGTPVNYVDTQGRTVVVARYEHTVILIGYNSTTVWVVDAYDGLTKSYPLSAFLRSWQVLENQGVFYAGVEYSNKVYIPLLRSSVSVVASDLGPQATPTLEPIEIPESYIVQAGDWLGKIANQFEVPWERLAEINDLYPPYELQPGQEIRLSP